MTDEIEEKLRLSFQKESSELIDDLKNLFIIKKFNDGVIGNALTLYVCCIALDNKIELSDLINSVTYYYNLMKKHYELKK